MSAEERCCIGCTRWQFDPGGPGYSEYTPGEDWSACCTAMAGPPGAQRRRWELSGYDTDGEVWFKTMQQAKTCPDYDPRPGAPN